MGGCYSSESKGALTSPRHKLPRDKPLRQSKKDPQYSSATNGSAPQDEDLITASTKVPLLAEPVTSPTQNSHHVKVNGVAKGVVPSDSGIESLGSPTEESNPIPGVESNPKPGENKGFTLCRSCHSKLQRISRGPCNQCGNFRVDATELTAMVNNDTYCTCGPRQPGKQSTCRTHGKGKASPLHRHSDIPTLVLKSSLRKELGRGDGKKVRMSWKSADSLDMNNVLNTCMDRAKSEASDVFGDDVSFKAPLAQFDSVEHQLNHKEDQCDAAFLASRMSIYSEILDLTDCICKCDFASVQLVQASQPPNSNTTLSGKPTTTDSARNACVCETVGQLGSLPVRTGVENGHLCLTEEDDEDSGHGMSKSDDHSGSVSELEPEAGDEGRSLSSHSSPVRLAAASVVDSLSSEGEDLACPVSVMVKGRQLVVMDATTYTQMLEDLAMLKEQLSLLTQVIQEEEDLGPLNLSLELDD
ncbi:uncharacterized protein [Littorina saxatilis]|uniref:uncharacterized protein n=1 Tax=Littorina saxatilis TaxID=31220 RepID=UPI0038B63FAD